MGAHQWDFTSVVANWPLLAQGLANSLRLAAVCLGAGLALGLVVGAGRYSRRWLLYLPASAFVEVFRNTPALVQIMWFFFAFPIVSPFDIDAFSAAALALTLNTAAFAGEIYRGGIQSIAPGQWEAARALGMTHGQQMRRVILPQAVRRMLPAFVNRGVELVKMTSLASVIAFGELMHQAKTLSTLYFNPIETYTVAALVFFAVIYPGVLVVQRLERRLRRRD